MPAIVTRCVDVALTIPDNEAETALATLRRLGVELGELRRADLYCIELEREREEETIAALRGTETIFNPNKHALRVRFETSPSPGEVWVDELPHEAREPSSNGRRGALRVAGLELPGLRRIDRFTAWQLFDVDGNPASPELVRQATETLLCNPAFQRATFCR